MEPTNTSQNRDYSMPDTELSSAPIDPAYFEQIIFMGSEPKMVTYENNERVPLDRQKQETNKDGVPKWRVMVTARTAAFGNRRGGDVKNITLTVTTSDDPGEGLAFGAQVELQEQWLGFMRQRNGNVSIWHNARGIRPVGAPQQAVPANK